MPPVIHDLLGLLGLQRDSGDWILPRQLLACGYPRTNASLAALREAGISLLVNLHTAPHSPAALARRGLRELHLPTPDFEAPTAEALRLAVREIGEALTAGQGVAVHCGAGRGRTGTVMACVLVSRGATAREAIATVRRLRPGSIETTAQEEAVARFADRSSLP